MSIRDGLLQQSNDATRGHAQAFADLTQAEREEIVDFELGLHSAQGNDVDARVLNADQATSGSCLISLDRSAITLPSSSALISKSPSAGRKISATVVGTDSINPYSPAKGMTFSCISVCWRPGSPCPRNCN